MRAGTLRVRDSRDPKTFSAISYATCNVNANGDTIKGIIKSSGKAIESLVARRKLGSLRNIFPHGDKVDMAKLEKSYADLLELSRPGFYSTSIRKAAIRLLLEQINSGFTSELLTALEDAPEIEIRYLLAQIMSAYTSDVAEWESNSYLDPPKYKASLIMQRYTPRLIGVLEFISDLAKQNTLAISDLAHHNTLAIQAALRAGFLDMLMYIYINFPALYLPVEDCPGHPSTLLRACRHTIHTLSVLPELYEWVYRHPVYDLWLGNDPTLPIYRSTTTEMLLEERALVWKSMQTSIPLIKMRVAALWQYSSKFDEMSSDEILQAATDLIEFTSSQIYLAEVSRMALLTIFKWIVTDGPSAQQLIDALARASGREITHTISNVVQLWLEYANARDQPDEDVEEIVGLNDGMANNHGGAIYLLNPRTAPALLGNAFYEEAKELLFSRIQSSQSPTLPRNDTAILNMISFIIAVVSRNNTSRSSLVDSGALALALIAYVDGVPLLSDLLHPFQQSKDVPDRKHSTPMSRSRSVGFTPSEGQADTKILEVKCLPLALVNTVAHSLWETIQDPAFVALLRTPFFATRRHICVPLLNALLGRHMRLEGLQDETRTVLSDILQVDD